ncbi:hypothetical protein C2G38_2144241 [Gigaspora rosea]|uniref:F-box domain-containing protein n=1 Tax=Gigaspora rosea TaxID=44941 RepID=A0A397UZ95_9GLOM|nr:hypothetical protein C2G38_2144241 [Gigaspora rosea]
MPELMENILNNLDNEFYSLYSCALVSRHWCKMSIPILWQDPFKFQKKPMFISRYFSYLDEEEKVLLKECGIIINFPNTLFNYAKFLKVLDLSRLEENVRLWINFQISNQKIICISKDDLANLLFKLFIESGAILSKFDIYFTEFIIKPNVFYSLGQNEHFFSRLQDLTVDVIIDSFDFGVEEAIMLLRILAKTTTKISTLNLGTFGYNYEPQIYQALVNIIKSQGNLRRFSLICETEFQTAMCGVISALESQRKNLQEIKLDGCAYSAEFKVLMNCEKLKVLRILYCEEKKLLKILDTGLCKISTLEISSYPTDASNLLSILKKSGTLLQRLKLDSEDEICSQSLLFDTLIAFCPNITHLYISYIKLSAELLKLIGSLQKLQLLTLRFVYNELEMENLDMQFAKILPSTLQYLEWSYIRNDILLNYCEAPLKKLKKTLKYVSLSRSTYISNSEFNNIRKDLEGYVKLVRFEEIEI